MRVFQACCISHFTIFRPNLEIRKQRAFLVYSMIFWISYISYVFCTIHIAFVFDSGHKNVKWNGRPLMYYVNALSVFGTYATHLTTPLETLFWGKREKEICEEFKIISEMFAAQLNYIPNYRERRTKYIYRIVFLFVFIAFLGYSSAFIRLPDFYEDKFFMQPTIIFNVILLRIRWCQIGLYLNITADTLNDLQLLLKQHRNFEKTNERLSNASISERIQSFRDIHLHVWLITGLISDCFGLTLTTFVAKAMLELINGAYWFYINLKRHESMALNLRMV